MTPPEPPSRIAATRRVRVAQLLALVGLAASAVGAVGPADHIRTTYSWPPPTLPKGTPERAWYTPLLLARHRAETVSAHIPCALPPALPDVEGGPVTVLATARTPERADALAVRHLGDRLVVAIGDEMIAQVRLPPVTAGSRECSYLLQLEEGRWALTGGPAEVAREGALRTWPNVSGLFSELDLRSGDPPRIEVTTAVHTARPTVRQTIAWTISALSVALALVLVAIGGRPRRPWTVAAELARSGVQRAHLVDAVVAIVLLAWWIISPANFDDGWLIARQRLYDSVGGFSAYYSTYATNLPLDYWLEWMQHWLVEVTSAALLLRLPALLCLAVTWLLCRWIFARVAASAQNPGTTALWALAFAFLLGALAWGMTLRPEPATVLLVTGVMACMLRFLEHETSASVALAAVLVSFSLTAHPAGVVALAPILVASPQLVRWARARRAIAVTVIAATTALLGTLTFVGSDAELRVLDARTTRAAVGEGRDEIVRYFFLSDEPFGTPLRRGSVALILLAVLSFLLARRRGDRGLLGFPGSVLAVGLVLLIATPSKWPSHFGTLTGVAAVAVAAETMRLRGEGARWTTWRPWPFLAIGATMLAASWSWWTRRPWNAEDLRTLDWGADFAWDPSLPRIALITPLVLLAAALLFEFARGQRRELRAVPWRVASWTAPVLAIPLVVFTIGVLAADTVRTSSWTFGRQNIEALTGDRGCGLAEDVLVSAPHTARSLALAEAYRPATPAWVPPAPVAMLRRFALGPVGEESARSAWFELPRDRRFGLFVTGGPATSDSLMLEWGRLHGKRIEPLSSDEIGDVVRAPAGNTPWRFFATAELPAAEPNANAVRVTLRTGVAPGSAIAVTAPVTYSNERLAPALERAGSRSLVYPEMLPYFPCADLPVLHDGIVEVPDRIVISTPNPVPPLRYNVTSPFLGLLDLYEIERIPVADTTPRLKRLQVYDVDRRIPGTKLAPPVVRRTSR